MSNNLNQFQSALDNITIGGRIMDTNLGETLADETTDVGVKFLLIFK